MKIKEIIAILLVLFLIVEPVTKPVTSYARENDSESDTLIPTMEWSRELPAGGMNKPQGEVVALDMTVEEYLKEQDDFTREYEFADTSDELDIQYDIFFTKNAVALDRPNGSSPDQPVSSEWNGHYRYSQFSDLQKAVYDAIERNLEEFAHSERYKQDLVASDSDMVHSNAINTIYKYSESDMKNKLTREDLYAIFSALYEEGYSYYWLWAGYAGKTLDDGVELTCYVDSEYYTYESRYNADTAINALVSEWYDEIDSDWYSLYLSDEEAGKSTFYGNVQYGIALKLHDLIIERINYAYNDKGDPETASWAHSIAGVATEQGVVCEGYAKMYSYMLNMMHIPNLMIVGDAPGGGHAWNAISFDRMWSDAGYPVLEYSGSDSPTQYCDMGDNYVLCDLTWDDPNSASTGDLSNVWYNYFCIPSGLFKKQHTPEATVDWPDFFSDDALTFYRFFGSYTTENLNSDSAKTFRDIALGHQYSGNDYVHFVVPNAESISILASLLGVSAKYYSIPMGYMLLYESPRISNPALSIAIQDAASTDEEAVVWNRSEEYIRFYCEKNGLDIEECPAETEGSTVSGTGYEAELGEAYNGEYTYRYMVPIDVKSTHTFTVVLPEDSDDRAVWTTSNAKVARISTNGKSVTVTGRRGGFAVLTAATYAGKAKVSFLVQVGAGEVEPDYIIWAGGSTAMKSVTVSATLKPTIWKDSKGKTKQGKLVWLASDTDIDIAFDTSRHKVTTTTAKTIATVSSSGKVTAKKPGLSYIYVCDTGSCKSEMFVIEVRNAPSKLYLSQRSGSKAKADLLKTVGLPAGQQAVVHITPESKNGDTDPDCSYTVSVAKDEYSGYIKCGDVYEDAMGYMCFNIIALDIDRIKNKSVTTKINVVNNESGKKTTLTVKIDNPAKTVKVTQTGGTAADGTTGLGAKSNTVTLKLDLNTALGSTVATTDKLELYVGMTYVNLKPDGKGVTKDSGAKVSAKIDKNNSTGNSVSVVLKATSNPGKTAVVYAGCKNALTKLISLFPLADVDERGVVTIK